MDRSEIALIVEGCQRARHDSEQLITRVADTVARVFDGRKRALEATTVIVDAQSTAHPVMVARLGRLSASVGRSPVIEDAKGILAAQYGMTRGEAFEVLRQISSRSNRKLHDVAAEVKQRSGPRTIVARVGTGSPS
jgi:hypothetical protein